MFREKSKDNSRSISKSPKSDITLKSGETIQERRKENNFHLKNSFGQVIDKSKLDKITLKIKDINIRIIHRKDDKKLDLKINYIKNSIGILKKNGVDLPKDIRIKLAPEIDESYAFNGSKEGQDYSHVYLGNNLLEYNPKHDETSKDQARVVGGVGYGIPRILGDQIYDRSWQGKKIKNRATACIIHELGHIMHERTNPIRFYELGDIGNGQIKGKEADRISEKTFFQGEKVSEYASRLPNEFVAEVFTGLNFGIKYDQEVLNHYKDLAGPFVQKK